MSLTEPQLMAVFIIAMVTYLCGIQSISPRVISDIAADEALSVC